MKPWTSRRVAKVMAFYIVNAAIVGISLAVLLEIWGLLTPERRNQVLSTLGVLAVAGLCVATTNYWFAVSESESEEAGAGPIEESEMGKALREAKVKDGE